MGLHAARWNVHYPQSLSYLPPTAMSSSHSLSFFLSAGLPLVFPFQQRIKRRSLFRYQQLLICCAPTSDTAAQKRGERELPSLLHTRALGWIHLFLLLPQLPCPKLGSARTKMRRNRQKGDYRKKKKHNPHTINLAINSSKDFTLHCANQKWNKLFPLSSVMVSSYAFTFTSYSKLCKIGCFKRNLQKLICGCFQERNSCAYW